MNNHICALMTDDPHPFFAEKEETDSLLLIASKLVILSRNVIFPYVNLLVQWSSDSV